MSNQAQRSSQRPIYLATRGSALALVQANMVLAACRAAFPDLNFEIRIFKTTGDHLQSVPPDVPGMPGTKGLFTKELEVALLSGEADLAVHSLKDLPTELPEGLELSAVLPRADVRDVLLYRDQAAFALPSAVLGSGRDPVKRGLNAGAGLRDFPPGATIATSSPRRQAQLLALRPDLKVMPIRGNVGTRLQKLADRAELDGLVLAAAGLERLHFRIEGDGQLSVAGKNGAANKVPAGLRATFLPVEEMVPCVGQGAIGIEGRAGDRKLANVFACLNDPATLRCVTAERSFLRAMGGGCLSPVAAYTQVDREQLHIRAVSFQGEIVRRTVLSGPLDGAAELGAKAAAQLKD